MHNSSGRMAIYDIPRGSIYYAHDGHKSTGNGNDNNSNVAIWNCNRKRRKGRMKMDTNTIVIIGAFILICFGIVVYIIETGMEF